VRVSVFVPSYRRPALLRNCLAALARQTRPPDEVVVTLRDTDLPSRSVIDEFRAALPLRLELVAAPGPMPAYNRGVQSVIGDIVCITDDDTEPFPDWVERIEKHFEQDASLGAVGGRDYVHWNGVRQATRAVTRVGIVQWFGRTIGNHSQDAVGAREVDCLKGCNMALRTDLPIRFDERLRGDAYHMEVAICLAVKRANRRILFDPQIRVNHFPGARPEGADRLGLAPERLRTNGFNQVMVLMPYIPLWRRAAFLVWTFVVGDVLAPGLVRALLLCGWRLHQLPGILLPAQRGKLEGLKAWRTGADAAS
jgi:glycosyltransferase involved in cell wall biosynthesis